MTDLSELRFFQTAEHVCGYLPDQQASNIFVDPEQEIDANTYSILSTYGFRRSGKHVYRPRCANCQACIPFRVLTKDFHPSKSQRRCLKRNEDLRIFLLEDIDNDECYALYESYINERHHDGEMYPPSREQYSNFLSSEWGATRYLAMRDKSGKLISVAICDFLHQGLSAMYSFFTPGEPERSLGVYNILYQVQWARELDLPYLYLGYWIKNCQKMLYKSHYRPYQLFENNQWVTHNSCD